MHIASICLPNDPINATSIRMPNKINHTELCEWLTAVATHRDKQAFTHLFQFFSPKIQRIAKIKVNTDARASEVVQETMGNVWRKALRKVKSNREDTLSDDIWSLAESQNIQEDDFTDHLANNNLRSVIDDLPENQQQVIKAYYFMEMSQDQLAVHLNLPLGTIKSRLRLALGKLKAQLGESHD